MTDRSQVLGRIADALERIAPPSAEPIDWQESPAYFWDGKRARSIATLSALNLDRLRGIEAQKGLVVANIDRLISGSAAHDMLLWGVRGMGKSALVRAAVKAAQSNDPSLLALVQIAPGSLASFPALLEALSQERRAFVLFFDDLGFGSDENGEVLAMRSLLDGTVMARPAHIRLAVTSNRRGIVQRDSGEADAVHERDERDSALALADRFGLTLGFHPCDRETYLEILKAYTDPLGLDVDEEEALAWAIARGNRSGRSAYQFATELAGRAGLSL